MKHTSGPWDAWFIGDKGLWCVAKKENGRVIDNTQENAQLISAAPDMYEALKDIIEHDNTVGVYMSFDEIVAKARAAIAKAEGKGA